MVASKKDKVSEVHLVHKQIKEKRYWILGKQTEHEEKVNRDIKEELPSQVIQKVWC